MQGHIETKLPFVRHGQEIPEAVIFKGNGVFRVGVVGCGRTLEWMRAPPPYVILLCWGKTRGTTEVRPTPAIVKAQRSPSAK